MRPDICQEWDYERNTDPPETYSPYSSKMVWWRCKNSSCDCHVWEASPDHRAYTGCPFCSSKRLCPHNNLKALCPDICQEWDYERNEKSPEMFSVASGVSVWWRCKNNPCGCHKWEASIYIRTGLQSVGCPFCANKKICPHNNLKALHPDICQEWDYERNIKPSEEYSPGGDVRRIPAVATVGNQLSIQERVLKNMAVPIARGEPAVLTTI